MSWFKVKLNPNDTKFSNLIRTRDNWHCVYGFKCLKNIDFRTNKGGLQCSHFQKRGKWSVRYDLENCDATCIPCHYFVENDPKGQKTLGDWKLRQLGTQRYNLLILRANTPGKRDDFLTKLYIKELEKEIK